MAIKKGNKVKADYTGTFDDGEVFDSSTHGDHSHPLEFTAGEGQVIKGFDDAVIGMEKGQEKNIKIKPLEAYGDVNPQLMQKIPRDKIAPGQEVKPGMIVGIGTPDGQQFPAKIAEVTDTQITLDLNHPLAGKTLNFKIKIIDYS